MPKPHYIVEVWGRAVDKTRTSWVRDLAFCAEVFQFAKPADKYPDLYQSKPRLISHFSPTYLFTSSLLWYCLYPLSTVPIMTTTKYINLFT